MCIFQMIKVGVTLYTHKKEKGMYCNIPFSYNRLSLIILQDSLCTVC